RCVFFQAEDGIRDRNVTGVQTCALPILGAAVSEEDPASPRPVSSWLDETRDSYDSEASGYRDEVQGILDRLPHLRAHLRLFAELIDRTADGPVADIGCGPGYATGFLGDLQIGRAHV